MEWIRVEDRLPEPYQSVLVYYEHDKYHEVDWIRTDGSVDTWQKGFPYEPTYWMPLPEPPKTT